MIPAFFARRGMSHFRIDQTIPSRDRQEAVDKIRTALVDRSLTVAARKSANLFAGSMYLGSVLSHLL